MSETTTATVSYTHVAFPADADAYRRYGHYHAATRESGRLRTLCGRLMEDRDFAGMVSEPHRITCKRCQRVIASRGRIRLTEATWTSTCC